MKKLLILLFTIITQINFGQTFKELADFNKLKTFDGITLKLIQSEENKILIPVDYQDKIEIITINEELKIRMKIENTFKGKDVYIELYFKNLDFIDTSEGSYIFNDKPLKQKHIDLNTKEGAKINLILETESLTSRAVSGAILDLSGVSKSNICNLGTGANLEAKNLKTEQTNILITTGAEATIFVSEFLDTNIKTGGKLYVYGNPKKVNKKNFLGGIFKLLKE